MRKWIKSGRVKKIVEEVKVKNKSKWKSWIDGLKCGWGSA